MSVIGVGVDVVEVARAERLLARYGAHVYGRLLTPAEARYCRAKRNPAPHIAARLAAKEAAYKALQGSPEGRARGIGWREIEVTRARNGMPVLRLHRLAARCADELGATRLLLSLSHTHDTAAAIVLVADD